jgi:flavin-dependent dehydrogenase
VRPFASADTVLVGDAAGLVSPLTGGGIHAALASGRAAGIAIADHLLAGGPTPGSVLRGSYRTSSTKRLLRAALDLAPSNRWIDRALRNEAFVGLAQMIFFHHRGLMSAGAWQDLKDRLPT